MYPVDDETSEGDYDSNERMARNERFGQGKSCKSCNVRENQARIVVQTILDMGMRNSMVSVSVHGIYCVVEEVSSASG